MFAVARRDAFVFTRYVLRKENIERDRSRDARAIGRGRSTIWLRLGVWKEPSEK